MTTLKLFILVFLSALYGCGQNPTNRRIISNKIETRDSVSESEIYDFMKVVIANQKLKTNNGLSSEPKLNCDISLDDKEFLKSLLIDTTKQETNNYTDTTDWKNGIITFTATTEFGQLDKCLTNADIAFMLQQKADHSNFKWQNTKLGFNIKNDSTWYAFSVPLFSKDKSKAIIMIEDLCSGLCGLGWSVLFKKEDNQWISQTGNQWFH